MGISLGLVGLGQFGSAFAQLFRSHPLVDRVGLCDREPERIAKFADDPTFQEKFNKKDVYGDLDDILKADLDALVIITQPWLHAEQAVKTMEAGKDVYSAVPIVSLPDGDEILGWCDKIIETSLKTGKRYMLGETTFYRPQTMFCRRKAAENAFGEFIYAEGDYFHDLDKFTCSLRQVSAGRLDGKSGREWSEIKKKYLEKGVLSGPMHYPTHSTCGPVTVMRAHAEKVTAYGYENRNNDPYFADTAFSDEMAFFKMSNGATVRICEFREVAGSIADDETFRILGTKGSYAERRWMTNHRDEPMTAKDLEETMFTDEEMRDPLPEEVAEAFKIATQADCDPNSDFVPTGHGGSHPYMVHEFIDAVANGRQPAINAWEAARYMAMGVMAHKSALKDGETLDVPDWGEAPE